MPVHRPDLMELRVPSAATPRMRNAEMALSGLRNQPPSRYIVNLHVLVHCFGTVQLLQNCQRLGKAVLPAQGLPQTEPAALPQTEVGQIGHVYLRPYRQGEIMGEMVSLS
jgi:hypothetical protein